MSRWIPPSRVDGRRTGGRVAAAHEPASPICRARHSKSAVALRTPRASTYGALECAESRHASVGRRGSGVARGCGCRPTLPTSLCAARSQTFPRRRRISANASDSQTSCPQEKRSASQPTEPDLPQKWQRFKPMKLSRAIRELSICGRSLHIGARPRRDPYFSARQIGGTPDAAALRWPDHRTEDLPGEPATQGGRRCARS